MEDTYISGGAGGWRRNVSRQRDQIIQAPESKGFKILSIRITWGTLKQTNKTQMSGFHLKPIYQNFWE